MAVNRKHTHTHMKVSEKSKSKMQKRGQSKKENNDNNTAQKGLLKAHKRKRHVYKADAHVVLMPIDPAYW